MALYGLVEDPLQIFTKHEQGGYAMVPVVYLGFPTVVDTPAKDFTRRLSHVVAKLPFFLANDESKKEVDDKLGPENFIEMGQILGNVVEQFQILREVEPIALTKAAELHKFFTDEQKNPRYGATCQHLSNLSECIGKFDPESGQLLSATGQQTLDFMIKPKANPGEEKQAGDDQLDGDKKPAAEETKDAEEEKEESSGEQSGNSSDKTYVPSDDPDSPSRRKRAAAAANTGTKPPSKKTRKNLGAKQVTQN